jgi:hypothetical protein
MARAPSRAGPAREGSSWPIWPVALARSQACAASSARYMSTRVAPVYSSPHGIACRSDKLESSPHARAASCAALRSWPGASDSST